MRRKLLLAAVVLVACVLIALATLPWWLGGALRVGGAFGLTFAEYQKIGYNRFVLREVEVRRPGVRVEAASIEMATPLAWLAGDPGEVAIGRWSVAVTPDGDSSRDENRPQGWRPLRERLTTIFVQLESRVSSASAGAGELSWPGGELGVEGVTWSVADGGRLEVNGLAWRDEHADATLTRTASADLLTLQVQSRASADAWEATLESAGADVSGRGLWWGQPASVRARFDEEGWRPAEAVLSAPDWRLPASRAKLGEFYDVVTGRAEVVWRDSVLTVDVDAKGRPRTDNDAPPLEVRLHGAGGLERLNIERLDVRAPGVEGRLSEPVVIARDGRLLSDESSFGLTINLAEQPWFAGRGQVSGTVRVKPRGDGLPLVTATLSGTDAAISGWVATRADVETRLDWPRLSVTTATVKLAGGDELETSGEWDFSTRTLAAGKLKGRVSRDTAARWLPAGTGFDMLAIDAAAEGVWPDIVHRARVDATGATLSRLRPLALALDWQGRGSRLDSVVVNATANETRIDARASLTPDAARIEELVLARADGDELRLTAPMNVRWRPALVVGDFELKGAHGRLAGALNHGERDEVKLGVEQFDSTWLNDVLELPGPDWRVERLAVQGSWAEGPLVFTAEASVALTLEEKRHADFQLLARGDARQVEIETLRVAMDGRPVARASGRLPATFHPREEPRLRMDEDGALAIDAATEPNALFWEHFTALTGLIVIEPEVRLSMAGSLKKPEGEATMNIARIAPDASGRLRRWPAIERLDARMIGDLGGVALETFTMAVDGQSVRASGRLPVRQWTALARNPLGLARAEGEARIEILNAEVSALARYAPAYLAPTGTLNADVTIGPGERLAGVVRLQEAATRPLGPLGSLQSVNAEIVLDDRMVELKNVSAVTGGRPVVLSGTVELQENGPRLDLLLKGENLPFVRQAGLLVRGDLDLRVVTDEHNTTRVSGATRLRDSLFLMDVRALIPSGGTRGGPGRRPPYFAVDVPPFDAWNLDVTVDGDRFMRMHTPLFSGLASAHFHLTGTLGDPRATGEATVNEGRVLLPFTSFDVRQGEVRLTEANPFEPRISLIGTSRRYGYDLRMEVTGTADKPRVTFTSTPGLESEQVLLMVMTGETPQNEISYSTRERVTRLGTYLGQSLIKQLGGDPASAERLSINVGERVSRQGRETYGVEYELNPRWSLVGEYDEFDEYNVGAKWRVLSEKRKEDAGEAGE